jgi:uncharacterized protein (TIGR00251 family)
MPYKEMRIKVLTRSRYNRVSELADGRVQVDTEYPAEKGLANMAIINLLAEYYKVAHKCVVIVSGHTSPNKTVRIYDESRQ